MEKDRLEVFLEDIQGKLELVLEDHESLRKEIREAREESNQKHEHTAFLIETIIKKIDTALKDLADHRADTEVHKKAYLVSDSKDGDKK